MTHMGTRDTAMRMPSFFNRNDFRSTVMKANRVTQGIDVLICHPRLARTGFDLIAFPTNCWLETDDSVYRTRHVTP